jgi:transposase
MQGQKQYQEQLFQNFQLSAIIPRDNFYRRLKATLDLSFLYKQTFSYYGSEGRKSIDPVVFFKLMLIGYIENIQSDRKIIEQASMRMDMLYFIGYDITEPLPWHSTLSRTRKLFGRDLFLEVFRSVLHKCVAAGMVQGETQSVDSAHIRAHASRDSMVTVSLEKTPEDYLAELTTQAANDENKQTPSRPSKRRSTYNCHNRSATDPDARLTKKGRQPLALNYAGQISVDTSSHVICGAMADFADKRDAQSLPAIVGQTIDNLGMNNMSIKEVLADTAYSSGESLRYLEQQGITGYLPCVPNYLPSREGFSYCAEGDYYLCRAGIKLPFKSIVTDYRDGTKTKTYRPSAKDCRHCSFREACLKGKRYKQITDTVDKPYYDRMYARISTESGKNTRKLRASTVEPVLGTLLHFRRMKKVYTKGIDLANKHVLLAATAYNITKLMKTLLEGISSTAINGLLKLYFTFSERKSWSLLTTAKIILFSRLEILFARY